MERIEDFVGPERGLGTVQQLPFRQLVADYCDKYIALDRRGRPAAFVVLSPPSHPTAVRDSAAATQAARDALGPNLGESILTAHHVGELAGCSYSITPYCKPLSGHRLLGRWERMRMAPGILAWLAQTIPETVRDVDDAGAGVRLALQALADRPSVNEATRRAATDALRALDDEWRPRHVLAHNDLWWGNFVRRPATQRGKLAFYVIDWGGSTLAGLPFYDLVRVARSLNLDRERVRREFAAHMRLVGCERQHVRHYLSAAFGSLACNLGEWPEAQFARAADECIRYVEDSLS